jgi:hypothetical protein
MDVWSAYRSPGVGGFRRPRRRNGRTSASSEPAGGQALKCVIQIHGYSLRCSVGFSLPYRQSCRQPGVEMSRCGKHECSRHERTDHLFPNVETPGTGLQPVRLTAPACRLAPDNASPHTASRRRDSTGCVWRRERYRPEPDFLRSPDTPYRRPRSRRKPRDRNPG